MTKDEQLKSDFDQLARIYAQNPNVARVVVDGISSPTRVEMARLARDLAAMLEPAADQNLLRVETGITSPHMRPPGAGIG